jgi:GNAT superfamily N-acetyltransferase
MEHWEVHHQGYVIHTDKNQLDVNVIHEYLSERSYWAIGRSRTAVETSIRNSLCFGLFAPDGHQAGFARVVTDRVTFAWICDLFILETYRGTGLGKWLVQTIEQHPDLRTLRRQMLITRDAHGLYRDYAGFNSLQNSDRWMERLVKNSTDPEPKEEESR